MCLKNGILTKNILATKIDVLKPKTMEFLLLEIANQNISKVLF